MKVRLPKPIRAAIDMHGLWGLLGLGVGMTTTFLVWAESHPWLVLLGVLGFPLGVWTAAGMVFVRGKALAPPVAQTGADHAPRRPRLKPFERYNVEWAEDVLWALEMRCPVHHTPLLFWEGEHLGTRPRPRSVTDRDTPFRRTYLTGGTLFCEDGKEEFLFPEELTVAQVKHRIRVSLRGAENRGEQIRS